MTMKTALGVMALVTASSATAAPKYLHCAVGDNSFNVTADEAQSSIVYQWHGTGSISTKGKFDLNTIFWFNEDQSELLVADERLETFAIDRTTLAIENVRMKNDGKTNTITGKCTIQKPSAKRAI